MDKGPYGRRDRLVKEKRHDAYQTSSKWPEPTICTDCGSLFQGGRWTWNSASVPANRIVCPACQRIADNYPAGYIEITGTFFPLRRNELLNLIRNEEQSEKNERPMERIISITESAEQTMVTTTGVHIARRIGEALARAYQGDFSFQYGDGEKIIRVYWHRV